MTKARGGRRTKAGPNMILIDEEGGDLISRSRVVIIGDVVVAVEGGKSDEDEVSDVARLLASCWHEVGPRRG